MVWKGSIQVSRTTQHRQLLSLSLSKQVQAAESSRPPSPSSSLKQYLIRRLTTTTTTKRTTTAAAAIILLLHTAQQRVYRNHSSFCCRSYTVPSHYSNSYLLPRSVYNHHHHHKSKQQEHQHHLLSSIFLPTTAVQATTTKLRNRQQLLQLMKMSDSNTDTLTAGNENSINHTKAIIVDPFCYRQFIEYYNNTTKSTDDYTGTIFRDVTIEQMERIVNERYTEQQSQLQDGYAPFCKHLFIANNFTTSAIVNVLPITPTNEHLLRSKYQARNDDELPVLIQYFPKELLSDTIDLPVAKYLDIILYSHEQILLENQARQQEQQKETETTNDNETNGETTNADDVGTTTTSSSSPPLWHIVSIKVQDIDRELPMTPITNMRNALGKEYGGSGIPIERDKYMECVHYWSTHATIS